MTSLHPPRNARPPAAGRWLAGPAEDAETDVEQLLALMRGGDREAAAHFITRYGSRVRRRVRGKLNPVMRRIFDSQDILSTVGRRLDLYVGSGQLRAGNVDQLWSLVFRMAWNAVIDKARVFRRLQEAEDEDGGVAQVLLSRLRRAERRRPLGVEIEIDSAMQLFRDPIDRRVLSMWLNGAESGEIAQHVDLNAAAVRKRWQRIRQRLQERLGGEASSR